MNSVECNHLKYRGLVKDLNENLMTNYDENSTIFRTILTYKIDVKIAKASDYYKILIQGNIEAPNALRFWVTIGGNENEFYESMTNARTCCKEPRLLATQFKILNNVWPTGEKLATWKIRTDDICFCKTKDTIIHALHDCLDTQQFINTTLQYLDKNQTFHNNITTLKIIFGVDDQAGIIFCYLSNGLY